MISLRLRLDPTCSLNEGYLPSVPPAAHVAANLGLHHAQGPAGTSHPRPSSPLAIHGSDRDRTCLNVQCPELTLFALQRSARTRSESSAGSTRGGHPCGLQSLWPRGRTDGTGGRGPGPRTGTYSVAASRRMERSFPPTTTARANPYTMGLGERLLPGGTGEPREPRASPGVAGHGPIAPRCHGPHRRAGDNHCKPWPAPGKGGAQAKPPPGRRLPGDASRKFPAHSPSTHRAVGQAGHGSTVAGCPQSVPFSLRRAYWASR